ncbi:MAG: hypothetical protein H8E30_08420 [Alphaproteobacteria bacterium]|nr:hypothetical protein [Alphaproteobacteria bacterium]
MGEHVPQMTTKFLFFSARDFVRSDIRNIIKVSEIPFLVIAILFYVDSPFLADIRDSLLPPFYWQIGALAETVVLALLSVNIHRRYLLGDQKGLGFGRREGKFLIAVFLLLILPSALGGLAGFLLMFLRIVDWGGEYLFLFLIIAPYTLVYLRLPLCFPAIAVENKRTLFEKLKWSWRTMRGANLRAFFTVSISVVFVLVVYGVLSGLILDLIGENAIAQVFHSVIYSLYTVGITVWTVLLVSVLYKYVTRAETEKDPEAIPTTPPPVR